MVAINKILLPECVGEGCGAETDICPDSRVHRRNAENRAPTTRNHRHTQPLVNNLYQGMTLDAVTGQYYERNRDYSPSLGRWMEQDPAQYINGANTYQFVDSSPVGNVDAEGTSWFTWSEGGWTHTSSGNPATATVTPANVPSSAAASAGPPPASPAPRLRGPLCPTCQRLYRKAAFDLSVLSNISERIHVINLGLQAFTGPGHFPVPHGCSISAARAERDRPFGELQIMRRLYLGDENAIARAGCPYPNLWPPGGPPKEPGLKLMPGTADAVGEVAGEAIQEIIFASVGV